jgi:hypothetical protein
VQEDTAALARVFSFQVAWARRGEGKSVDRRWPPSPRRRRSLINLTEGTAPHAQDAACHD